MAEIYLAIQAGLKGFSKLLVIKRILPQFNTNKSFGEMLLDEARIAATLTHPNVVQIYDVGSVDGVLFIAMEYLAGENLRTIAKALRQKGTWLDLGHALTIIMDTAAGLHYAHSKEFGGNALEIVHRDVSPKNVVVTYDGAVKVLDFGIAKASNKMSETRSGLLKGSLPYMSPEQARGEPLDRRSDVFSLGIVMYELTTGRRLFKERSDYEVLQKIVSGELPKPTELVPDYPAKLEEIVFHTLARSREDRFQSCRELYAELDGLSRWLGLKTGALPLQELMGNLFADRIEALRDAERQGRDYADALPNLEQDALESDSALVASGTGSRVRERTDALRKRSRRRQMELAAAGLLAAAVVVLILVVLAPRGSSKQAASTPPRVAATTATADAGSAPGETPAPGKSAAIVPDPPRPGGDADAAAAAAAAATREAGKPKRISVEVETAPRGARVYLGDRLVGVTPTKIQLEFDEKPVALRFKLGGYQDVTQKFVPDRDARFVSALSPTPRRRSSKPRGDEDLVDPFK